MDLCNQLSFIQGMYCRLLDRLKCVYWQSGSLVEQTEIYLLLVCQFQYTGGLSVFLLNRLKCTYWQFISLKSPTGSHVCWKDRNALNVGPVLHFHVTSWQVPTTHARLHVTVSFKNSRFIYFGIFSFNIKWEAILSTGLSNKVFQTCPRNLPASSVTISCR